MSEYKFYIFFLTLLLGVPVCAVLAARSHAFQKAVIALALFFSCFMKVHVNFLSMEWYRGTARGIEFTLVDLLTLGLLFAFLFSRDRKFRFFPPGWWLYFLYLLLSALSIMNSSVPVFSYFELWKMIRMYFFLLVFYNVFLRVENFDTILRILRYIVVFVFLMGLKQKYLDGRYQISSVFDHQNSMCMYVSVMGLFFLSAAYNKFGDERERKWNFLTFGVCSLLVVFSLSRGGLVAYAFGAAITILFSFTGGINRKKVVLSLLILLCGLAVGVKVFEHIYKRWKYAPEESKNDRIELAKMAAEMANSKFLGVGLNQFGEKSNEEFVADIPLPERARIHQAGEERIYKHQLVETTYMMIAAECGWVTLGVFLLMLLYFYFLNLKMIAFLKGKHLRYICVGWAGALAAIYFQTVLEWVLKQSANYYQLMLIFSSIAAMTTLRRNSLAQKKISARGFPQNARQMEPVRECPALGSAEKKQTP